MQIFEKLSKISGLSKILSQPAKNGPPKFGGPLNRKVLPALLSNLCNSSILRGYVIENALYSVIETVLKRLQ